MAKVPAAWFVFSRALAKADGVIRRRHCWGSIRQREVNDDLRLHLSPNSHKPRAALEQILKIAPESGA